MTANMLVLVHMITGNIRFYPIRAAQVSFTPLALNWINETRNEEADWSVSETADMSLRARPGGSSSSDKSLSSQGFPTQESSWRLPVRGETRWQVCGRMATAG